jgi:CelD/BcsL family acetyltransferase involved in cellulose biosynthesis
MFTIEPITRFEQLDALRGEWDDLLSASDANSIFLTWEWLRAWWDCFGSSHHLLVLKCSGGDGRLVALAAMLRTRRSMLLGFSGWSLYLLGDVIGGSEKLDWVIRKGYEPQVVPLLMDWLHRTAPPWAVLHYNTVRSDSAAVQVFLEECRKRRWFVLREEQPSYYLEVPRSWDTFLFLLSKNLRSSLLRDLRRAEKSFSVRARRCESLDQLSTDLGSLFALHAKRWQHRGKSGSLWQEKKQRFYFELGKRCLERDWLEFWLLEFDGKPVACEFGFRYEGIYSFLQAGFDPDYSSYSVGAVLRVFIVQDLIRRGFRGYDFLLGEEHYKERWCAEKRPLLFLSVARPATFGAVSLRLSRASRRLGEWLRSYLPAPVRALGGRVRRRLSRGANTPPPPASGPS